MLNVAQNIAVFIAGLKRVALGRRQRQVHSHAHAIRAARSSGIRCGIVVACAAVQHVRPGAAGQRVVPRAAVQRVLPRAAGQPVVPRAAVQHVGAGAAYQRVAAIGADQVLYPNQGIARGIAARYYSRAEIDAHRGGGSCIGSRICSCPAVQCVSARAAFKRVIACQAGDAVVAVAAEQQRDVIVAGCAVYGVVKVEVIDSDQGFVCALEGESLPAPHYCGIGAAGNRDIDGEDDAGPKLDKIGLVFEIRDCIAAAA